jgi:tripartite-type tricarboxylate transporter receptor subunit TctC
MAAMLSLAPVCGLQAQTAYPNKPIRIVVPYAPGGATDIMARTVAQRLGEQLGQSVLVENKPGANSGIGADAVAKAPADGYTLLFTNDATFVLNPVLFSSLSYNMARDFVPVATVAYLNLALVVSSTLPVNSFSELVAYTKAQSGKISYGSYVPIEIAAFFDAGVAWSAGSKPTLFGGQRDLVRSYGAAVRANVEQHEHEH